MDGLEITFNDRDLAAALKEFREDVAVKVVRASLRRIAKEEMIALQAVAPVGNATTDRHSGRLKENITFGTAFAIGRGIVKSFVRIRTTLAAWGQQIRDQTIADMSRLIRGGAYG